MMTKAILKTPDTKPAKNTFELITFQLFLEHKELDQFIHILIYQAKKLEQLYKKNLITPSGKQFLTHNSHSH